MYIHTYIHTYILTYLHTYIHTYIRTYVRTYITLHYITLHYITLHYITLHYITLHTYIRNCLSREKWGDSCTSNFPSYPGSHQGQRSAAFPAFARDIRRWKLSGLRSGILPRRRNGVMKIGAKKVGAKKVGMKMVGTRAETGKKLGDVGDDPSLQDAFCLCGFTPTEPGSMLWMYIVKHTCWEAVDVVCFTPSVHSQHPACWKKTWNSSLPEIHGCSKWAMPCSLSRDGANPPSMCINVHMYMCTFFHVYFVCLFACLFVCLYVYLFVLFCLAVCLCQLIWLWRSAWLLPGKYLLWWPLTCHYSWGPSPKWRVNQLMVGAIPPTIGVEQLILHYSWGHPPYHWGWQC